MLSIPESLAVIHNRNGPAGSKCTDGVFNWKPSQLPIISVKEITFVEVAIQIVFEIETEEEFTAYSEYD